MLSWRCPGPQEAGHTHFPAGEGKGSHGAFLGYSQRLHQGIRGGRAGVGWVGS